MDTDQVRELLAVRDGWAAVVRSRAVARLDPSLRRARPAREPRRRCRAHDIECAQKSRLAASADPSRPEACVRRGPRGHRPRLSGLGARSHRRGRRVLQRRRPYLHLVCGGRQHRQLSRDRRRRNRGPGNDRTRYERRHRGHRPRPALPERHARRRGVEWWGPAGVQDRNTRPADSPALASKTLDCPVAPPATTPPVTVTPSVVAPPAATPLPAVTPSAPLASGSVPAAAIAIRSAKARLRVQRTCAVRSALVTVSGRSIRRVTILVGNRRVRTLTMRDGLRSVHRRGAAAPLRPRPADRPRARDV